MTNTKFKRAIVMAAIAVIINAVLIVIGTILTAIPTHFDKVYIQAVKQIQEYYPNFGASYGIDFSDPSIEATMWVAQLVVAGILLLLLAITGYLIYKSRKNYELTIEDFQTKKGTHVGLVVLLFITCGSAGNVLAVSYSTILYLFSYVSEILSIIAAISLILCISYNTKQVRFYSGGYNQNHPQNGNYTYTYSSSNQQSNYNEPKQESYNEEVVDVVEEEKVVAKKVVNQASLDELYDLLSKLDRKHKDGEISDEDYQRMKETILNNYKNNS